MKEPDQLLDQDDPKTLIKLKLSTVGVLISCNAKVTQRQIKKFVTSKKAEMIECNPADETGKIFKLKMQTYQGET